MNFLISLDPHQVYGFRPSPAFVFSVVRQALIELLCEKEEAKLEADKTAEFQMVYRAWRFACLLGFCSWVDIFREGIPGITESQWLLLCPLIGGLGDI